MRSNLTSEATRFEHDEVFKATDAVLNTIKSSFQSPISTTPNPSLKKDGSNEDIPTNSPPVKEGCPHDGVVNDMCHKKPIFAPA